MLQLLGRSRGREKKPFPPPTPQTRVHDPTSSAPTADQYSLNRPELSTSLSSSTPPPLDLSASSISSPVLSPSGASMLVTSPHIVLSSSETGGPGPSSYLGSWGLMAPSIRLRRGCRTKVLRDAFCWRCWSEWSSFVKCSWN